MSAKLEGKIRLSGGNVGNFDLEQINLLRAIDETGSISAAAKQLSISYKTAWERLERLNNLASTPLVSRSAGGNQGGGSQLTAHGHRILRGFSDIEQEHNEFINNLGEKLHNLDDLAGFVRNNPFPSSARNQFLGTVTSIEIGVVDTEVSIAINNDVNFVAIIADRNRRDLKLEIGSRLIALVKATSIILTNTPNISVSARNRVSGHVVRLMRGKVNSEVVIDLRDGKSLTAVVTNHSSTELELQESKSISAFFKASSVVLTNA